jgi:hypothetical protein
MRTLVPAALPRANPSATLSPFCPERVRSRFIIATIRLHVTLLKTDLRYSIESVSPG